jgi:CheY-like chemotaxis protein
VHSIERLLDQVVLALHLDASRVNAEHRRVLDDIYGSTKALAGRRVLIVDDDIRNIFALAGALEQHGMTVLNAENGKDGIEALKNNPDINVVLMDIMMPDLDGYDTIRIMRGLEGLGDLPIIAVTAKAMKGDREKCIAAGASDYISKPVNVEQLVSLLRVRLVP